MLTTDDLARLRGFTEAMAEVLGGEKTFTIRTAAGVNHRMTDADLAELCRVYEAVLAPTDDMLDEALCSSAEAEEGENIHGDHLAMLIDFMGMGVPEKLPKARRIMRAAFAEAFRLVPLATAKGESNG